MSLSEHAQGAHEKTCQYKNMSFGHGHGNNYVQTQTLSLTMNSVFANANTKIAHESTFVNAS